MNILFRFNNSLPLTRTNYLLMYGLEPKFQRSIMKIHHSFPDLGSILQGMITKESLQL